MRTERFVHPDESRLACIAPSAAEPQPKIVLALELVLDLESCHVLAGPGFVLQRVAYPAGRQVQEIEDEDEFEDEGIRMKIVAEHIKTKR